MRRGLSFKGPHSWGQDDVSSQDTNIFPDGALHGWFVFGAGDVSARLRSARCISCSPPQKNNNNNMIINKTTVMFLKGEGNPHLDSQSSSPL